VMSRTSRSGPPKVKFTAGDGRAERDDLSRVVGGRRPGAWIAPLSPT